MRISFDSIKTEARAALSGERIRGAALLSLPIGMTVFFSVINYAANRLLANFATGEFIASYGALITTAVAALSLIAAVLTINPLRVYVEEWFVSNTAAVCKSNANKRLLRSSVLATALFTLRLLWLAAYMLLPAAAFVALWGFLSYSSLNLRAATVLAAGAAALTIIGLGFWLLTIQRYACAVFYLAVSPDITVRSALEKSRAVMEGRCLRMLAFKASFLPWFVLCAAVLPAGYVLPYYRQSLACYTVLNLQPI